MLFCFNLRGASVLYLPRCLLYHGLLLEDLQTSMHTLGMIGIKFYHPIKTTIVERHHQPRDWDRSTGLGDRLNEVWVVAVVVAGCHTF